MILLESNYVWLFIISLIILIYLIYIEYIHKHHKHNNHNNHNNIYDKVSLNKMQNNINCKCDNNNKKKENDKYIQMQLLNMKYDNIMNDITSLYIVPRNLYIIP